MLLLIFSCKTSKITTLPETQIVEVGTQGTVIVKAWGTAKKVDLAKEEACKNAVYAFLFKGFPSSKGVLSSDLRPLLSDPNTEETHSDYFKSFFANGGKYTKFVSFATGSGYVDANDKEKVKGLYKVGVVVVINKSLLIKELEDAGIKPKFGIN